MTACDLPFFFLDPLDHPADAPHRTSLAGTGSYILRLIFNIYYNNT